MFMQPGSDQQSVVVEASHKLGLNLAEGGGALIKLIIWPLPRHCEQNLNGKQ